MGERRGLARAAYVPLAGSVGAAVVGLVAAVRGAAPGRVGLLIAVALALLLAGAAVDALARAARRAAPFPGRGENRGGARPGPDELLGRYPRATLGWLRRRLGLSHEAFAAHLGAAPEAVAGWETRGRAIAPQHRRRILPLLARHLATPEGEAFRRSLGREEARAGRDG